MRLVNSFLTACWLQYFSQNKDRQITLYSPIPGTNPGWYFWLKNNSGVMEMIFLDHDQKTTEGTKESHFLLKYYPYPESQYFENLSCGEQIVRLSHIFDDSYVEKNHDEGCACSSLHLCSHTPKIKKGIPHFQERKNIHPSLFSLGKLSFAFTENDLKQITLDSQDQLIQYSFEGITILDSNGTPHELVAPGQSDRQMPAWEICWHFVSILTHDVFPQNNLFVKKCLRKISPGQVFYQGKGDDLWEKEDKSVTQIIHTFYF
ncbi:MAG: hypothetical protein PHS83_00895 [Clostridia bacterium]|nr:hypothetical protein [Clostridia bacterium]MDD4665144.1 hypothetical protein [Clostridia bacterium]